MRTWALEVEAARRREFRLFLLLSLLAHAALAWAFAVTEGGPIETPRGVISVDLVTLAPPPQAAPAPAAPEPEPPAPARLAPKPPVPEKVVLPKDPRPVPAEPARPRLEATIKPPEPRPEPEAPPEPEPAPPRAVERDYSDVLQELRAEAGEQTPQPERTARAGPVGSPTGTARPLSPEVADWMRRAKIQVRRNWVVPPGFRTQSLETRVVLDLASDGSVRGEPRIVKRSGNPWYDEGVVRAIQKASPLPPPPESGEWSFVFVPEDSY